MWDSQWSTFKQLYGLWKGLDDQTESPGPLPMTTNKEQQYGLCEAVDGSPLSYNQVH